MKIKIEREKCIGCGACASICPNHFKMAEDGKSQLIDGLSKSEKKVEKLGCAEDAVEGCPVQCIYIEKKS